MPEPRALTPTSYAILGLLAVQPWTTYELAKQMPKHSNTVQCRDGLRAFS